MDEINCKNCGEDLEPGSNFCHICGKPVRESERPIQSARTLVCNADRSSVRTIDLDEEAWKAIKLAAEESEWMPPDYMMNDWVSDVCVYLRKGGTLNLD